MARIPTIKTLTNSADEVLNAIRNSASIDYRNYVPYAQPNGESIREIGNIIMDYPALMNEFCNLINRIAWVTVTSKFYSDHFAPFKKGIMEMGETIEEAFVDLAKIHNFDPDYVEEIFKREHPDISVAFHVRNYKKFYKQSITFEDIKAAFLDERGVFDLIDKIIEAMYTSAEYDEEQVIKYMLGKILLKGFVKTVSISTLSAENMKSVVAKIRAESNKMTFMNPDRNASGVHAHTPREDQYVLMSADMDALADVEVMASAFHLDRADWLGHQMLVSAFGDLDSNRLAEIFADDPNYTAFTESQLTTLNSVQCIIIDRDFLQIYDNMIRMTNDPFIGETLTQQYCLHTWKTFSFSPFAQAVCFISGTPSITSVSVAQSSISTKAGQQVQINPTVTAVNLAPQTVTYSTTGASATNLSVSNSGVVTVASNAPAATYTVKVTSTYDTTKSANVSIVVTA